MTERTRLRWMILGVAIAAAVPYANVVRCGFVYDDHGAIEEAPLIHSLGNAWTLLTSDTWIGATRQPSGLYRPLTSLSFALNWALTGASPAPFHAVNVALHVVVCLLLFAALRRFGAGPLTSFAAAVLFAVHPLHTEAVTWIVGRAELIGAAFFLGGWLVHLRRDDADPRVGSLVALLYFLAMIGKESAATLPVVLLIGDLLRRRSAIAASSPKRDARWWAVRYGPACAALALFVVARWMAVGAWTPPGILSLANPLAVLPVAERLAGAIHVMGRYLLLMVWPGLLSVDYSYRAFQLPGSFADVRASAPAAIVIGMLAGAFALRRRHPAAALGFVFPFATFALTANILFPVGTIMAERLAYLPAAGLCILAGSIFGLAAQASPRPRRGRQVAAVAILALILVTGAARTWARNMVWIDDVTLWEETVRTVPDSWYANFSLAVTHLHRGEEDRALAALRECLRIHPRSTEIHNDIGDILRRRGDLDAATKEFTLELAANPTSTRAPFNLGLVHLARGRLDLAKQSFALAVRNDARNADAQYNLALILMGEGDLARARAHLEAARQITPQNPDILYHLGLVAAQRGDGAEARRLFTNVLTMKPDHASAAYNLGALALEAGAFAEARALFERVLKADPTALDARLNLAKTCLTLGDISCAREAARTAASAGAALPQELAALVRQIPP